MDYEDLRKYQRMERNSPALASVDASFYSSLMDLINEQRKKCTETNKIEDLKTLENIRKISRDVFDRREQKILMKTLRCVRTKDMQEDNIVEHEKEFFSELLTILKQNRIKFEGLLLGDTVEDTTADTTIDTTEAREKQPEKQEDEEQVLPRETVAEKIDKFKEEVTKKAEDLNIVLVRILKNIPKFVSSDMEELGPYEANEIKKLPEKEAKLLSEKKFAELI